METGARSFTAELKAAMAARAVDSRNTPNPFGTDVSLATGISEVVHRPLISTEIASAWLVT
jgi:hypothetical protein